MLFSCFGGNPTRTCFFRVGIVKYIDSIASDDHSLTIHCMYTTYIYVRIYVYIYDMHLFAHLYMFSSVNI